MEHFRKHCLKIIMVCNVTQTLTSQNIKFHRLISLLLTKKRNTRTQYLHPIYYRIQNVNHYTNVKQSISQGYLRPQRLLNTLVPVERVTDGCFRIASSAIFDTPEHVNLDPLRTPSNNIYPFSTRTSIEITHYNLQP